MDSERLPVGTGSNPVRLSLQEALVLCNLCCLMFMNILVIVMHDQFGRNL